MLPLKTDQIDLDSKVLFLVILLLSYLIGLSQWEPSFRPNHSSPTNHHNNYPSTRDHRQCCWSQWPHEVQNDAEKNIFIILVIKIWSEQRSKEQNGFTKWRVRNWQKVLTASWSMFYYSDLLLMVGIVDMLLPFIWRETPQVWSLLCSIIWQHTTYILWYLKSKNCKLVDWFLYVQMSSKHLIQQTEALH